MPAETKDRAREIMDVATALFAQHGYDGVSVRDICDRVGVNCSTISYYFAGKKGLYLNILRAQFDAYEDALNTIMAGNPNPKEELMALCDRLDTIHALCPHLSAISCRESVNPSPEFTQALSEHEAKYQGGHLANLIRAGQKQGLFQPRLNPIYLSRIFSMMFNSQIIARSTCGFLHPEMRFSDSDYFATVKAVLFEGLLAPSAIGSSADDPAAGRHRAARATRERNSSERKGTV